MDNQNPTPKPNELLDDLESIRRLLERDGLEPPLLTDQIDPTQIPLLSDVVELGDEDVPEAPGTEVPANGAPAAGTPAESLLSASAERVRNNVLQRTQSTANSRELARLDGELRAAAQLLLQDVIDDFVPQIEAELRRRLSVRLDSLLVRQKR